MCKPLWSDFCYPNTYRRVLVGRLDYADRYPEALRELSKWLSEGRLVRKFHVIRGLEKAPEALPLFFTGGNTGKLSVHHLNTDSLFCPRVVQVSGSEANL